MFLIENNKKGNFAHAVKILPTDDVAKKGKNN